jgi:hypothetical protein
MEHREKQKLKEHTKTEPAKIFQSNKKSAVVYNFENAILAEGHGVPGITTYKSDRGELPGNARGAKRIAITKTDAVKDTAFLAIASSGNMKQDRLVQIKDSFRTKSLNRGAKKKDHKDVVDVALGAYLCSYEATGPIILMSPRSMTRAAAIAVAILLYSTQVSQSKRQYIGYALAFPMSMIAPGWQCTAAL